MLRDATKWFVYATIALCCVSVGDSRTFAQDPERAELEERIEILTRRAAELRERGERNEFAEVSQEIQELKNYLRGRNRESSEGPRSRYLRQIFAAVDALRELGRPEVARRLLEIGQALRRESAGPVEGERDGPIVRRRIIRRVEGDREVREERVERDGEVEVIIERVEHDSRDERREGEEVEESRDCGERRDREGRRDREESRDPGERRDREGRRDREESRDSGERRDREGRRDREESRDPGERREREVRRDREERDEVERRRDGERPYREEHPEVRAAREQVAVLRMAMSALAEADREDGANQLERAIHALELAMEGRRDDEARRVRESAPSRGNQAEWLMQAHHILLERGNEERARAVGQLAERLAARGQRPRGDERNQELGRVQARIRELSAQLEELHRHVERLRRD